MCCLRSLRLALAGPIAVTIIAALIAPSISADPMVDILYPEREQTYCSGISSASGIATADEGVGVDRVYCQLYWYRFHIPDFLFIFLYGAVTGELTHVC